MRRTFVALAIVVHLASAVACGCCGGDFRWPNRPEDADAGDGPFKIAGKVVDPELDDLSEFLRRYREPDKVGGDLGPNRPARRTIKTLTFEKEGVRVEFTPNTSDRQTTAPPFERWVLVHYVHPGNSTVMTTSEAAKRLTPALRPGIARDLEPIPTISVRHGDDSKERPRPSRD